MADQIQFRGGPSSTGATFVGAEREITVDTTLDTLRVHDGTTAGGHLLATEADLTTAEGRATALEAHQAAVLSAIGVSNLATHLGAFTGSTYGDNQSLKQLLQIAETLSENKDSTLGVSAASTSLGAFSGSTIADNQSVKTAIQSLETATELRATIDSPAFTTHASSPEWRASGSGHLKLRAVTGNDFNLYLADQETLQITRDPSTGNPKFTAKGGSGEFKFNQAITEPSFSGHAYSPEWRATGTGHLKLRAETGNDLNIYLANQETLQITRDPSSGNPKFTAVGGSGKCQFQQAVNLVSGFEVGGTAITTTASELNEVGDLGTFTGSTIADNKTVKEALQSLETTLEAVDIDTDDLAALTGIAENITNLGTFTGSTIADSVAVKVALQSLETATELKAPIASPTFTTKIESPEFHAVDSHLKFKCDTNDIIFYPNNTETLQITRSGTDCRFTSNGGSGTFKFNQITEFAAGLKVDSVSLTTVQSSGEAFADNDTSLMTSAAIDDRIAVVAVASVTKADLDVDHLITLSGVSAAADDLGTFTGATIADSQTVKAALQALETKVEAVQTDVDGNESDADTAIAANETHIDNAVTLTGVAKDSTHLATFTGATIADNQTIKAALQALETKVEAVQTDVDGNESDADTAIALRATIASPTFTGAPAAPTASAATNTTQLATTAFVTTAISNLSDSAPGALDTLNELAAALGDDANFSTTVTNLINANETHIDNVATLSGVAKDSTHLGTFTGSTISDNGTVKAGMQELETLLGTTTAAAAIATGLLSSTPGTVAAQKTVIVDTNKDITGFRNVTLTGEVDAATGDFSGDVDIDGTANLDVVDIDGATQIDATVTVGVDDTGYDVKFFGDTASAYCLWDTSADDLILAGAAGLVVPDGQFTLGSTAVTSTAAELNVLDGLNRGHIIVGNASGAPVSLAEGSEGQNLTIDSSGDIVWAAATGGSEFTGVTAGTVSASKGVEVDSNKDITGFRNVTLTGELDSATLDVSGDADIDGIANLDAVDIDGDVDMAGDLTFSAAKDIHFIDNDAAALEFAEGGNTYLTFVTTDGSNAVKVSKNLDIDADDIDVSTQATDIKLIDNTALALRLMEGTTEYLRVTTTNSGEKIDVSTAIQLDGAVDINGAVDCSGDVTFSDAQTVSIADNLGFALRIMEDTNEYVRFTTTDGSELVDFSKEVKLDGGMTLGGGISIPASQDITLVASNSNALDFVIASGNRMMRFNTSTETVLMEQNIDVDGTTNLDAVDIDGAVQIDATVTVGVDDAGFDVKFFGNAASAYCLWDTSADDLILGGAAGLVVPEGQFTLGATAVTSTAAELNLVDGITAGTVAASKAVIVDSNKDVTGFRNVTATGEVDAATLDLSGNADIAGTVILSGGLTNAADDTAAASAGIAVNQLYRNGSVVMIRVS